MHTPSSAHVAPPQAGTAALLLAAGATLLFSACASWAPAGSRAAHVAAAGGVVGASRSEARPWEAPELSRLLAVHDGRSGERLEWDELLDALAEADVVFLGETHTDGTTHRVELGVYEGLLERRDGGVVLALEMLERDVQGPLDDYLAGRIDEQAFLAASRPWANYATAYRPLVEAARAAGRPVVASNFPRPLRSRVSREGVGVIEAAQAEGSRDVPAELLANTEAYWRRVDNAVRGHKGMLGGDDSPAARLISGQSLWDNSMGEACARALDEHPGALVLHVNGGFHSQYRDGTVRQLLLRRPDARVATVAIVPADSPATADVGGLPEADFIVFAERRSVDVERGEGAVIVPRRVGYHLHLPPQASEASPVPLLLWLSDDGLSPEDELDLWKARLGDEAAIAVIEAPDTELQADLAPGGRWFGSDDFTQDADLLRTAVERTWAVLLQEQPIDPGRVCLAGEGRGATAVAATALLAERLGARCVALEPRGYAPLRDIPLPLPELRGDEPRAQTSLRVIVEAGAEGGDAAGAAGAGSPAGAAGSTAAARAAAWWHEELASYADVGLPGALVARSADPWHAQAQEEDEVRAGLGLSARGAHAAHDARAAQGLRYILVGSDAPRARRWAERYALRLAAQDGQAVAVLDSAPGEAAAVRVPLEIRAAAFTADGALPKCPGAFGGTTVIVLPAGTPAEDLAAWKALETDDPLNRQSRFHRLRVATMEPDNLGAVLAELEAAGRTNILIVPAVFHADAQAMLALQRRVSAGAERFTLRWLPGLGAALSTQGTR